jgi:transcriptional regulator with XRE-family HTH domain
LESDTDRCYVGRVERGEENVTLDTMQVFAVALSVDVSALLIEIDPNTPKPAPLPSGRKPKAAK